MSIAAFYRSYIPLVATYTILSEGRQVLYYTPPQWMKCNMQPFKQGFMTELTEVGNIWRDWKVLYMRQQPVFDLTDIPEEASYSSTHAYYEGRWYAITATQDWSTAGRAPKHLKYLAVAVKTPDAPEIPVPVPLGTLVDRFEAAVRELQQVTDIVEQLIGE